MLSRWGVRKIICAGVSDTMCKYLAGRNILLVSGIAGEIENIINAYICNRLNDACFVMPGKKKRGDARVWDLRAYICCRSWRNFGV